VTTQELVERLRRRADNNDKRADATLHPISELLTRENADLRAAASRLSEMGAESKRLREALKPFADEWEYWKDDADIAEQGYLIVSDGDGTLSPANIPVAAFHAARAALEHQQKGEELK